jgi:hypothetical protein
MQAVGQGSPVRLVVEFTRTPDGRIQGVLIREGAEPDSFSGWLDLLRLLEAAASASSAKPSAEG